ncbi:MAG TPA: hypothetical protein VIH61_00090 [Waddliaceae bacterium]
MTKSVENIFLNHIQQLPEFITSSTLVKLNLFSPATLSELRQSGLGPPYLKISRFKYLYNKHLLIEWLQARINTEVREQANDRAQ